MEKAKRVIFTEVETEDDHVVIRQYQGDNAPVEIYLRWDKVEDLTSILMESLEDAVPSEVAQ